jgi:hypothetical protein
MTIDQSESVRPLGLGPGLFAVILIAAVRLLQSSALQLQLRQLEQSFTRVFRSLWWYALLFEITSIRGRTSRAVVPLRFVPPVSRRASHTGFCSPAAS